MVALGVVALGTYSVMSQLVSTREREFSLRLIFGARPDALGRMVLLQVARIVIPGLAIGLLAAWLAAGALRAFLFGVQPTVGVRLRGRRALLLLLAFVAAIPCAVRAMRVDVREGTS